MKVQPQGLPVIGSPAPGPNTQIGLEPPASEGAADLEWLCLLDALYALTEAEGVAPVASLSGVPAWPAHWHTLVGRWAERIGARGVQPVAPWRSAREPRAPRGSPTLRRSLLAQPPAACTEWPAISAQSLSPEGFSEVQAREFDALCAHLYAALALKASLDGVQASVGGLYGVIDALPLRLVLLDEQLNVVLLNRAANEWLAHTDPLVLHERRLRLPTQPAAFEQALCRFVADPFTAQQQLHLNGLDLQLKKLSCASVPGEPPAGPRFSVLLLVHERSEPGRHRVLVTPPALLARHLQDRHGLSDKELALAWNLAEGLSLKQYAALSGRSVETTRVQLKAVFRKLGIGDQKNIGVVLFDALHAVALQALGEHLATVVTEPRP